MEKVCSQDCKLYFRHDEDPAERPVEAYVDGNERFPYVTIFVLFTACRADEPGCLRSTADAGITLTSAPVSTRKRTPLPRSVRKKIEGRLPDRAEAPVTLSAVPGRLPTNARGAGHSCARRCRTSGVNSSTSVADAACYPGMTGGNQTPAGPLPCL